MRICSQRTLTTYVEAVALHYQHVGVENGVPQLSQTSQSPLTSIYLDRYCQFLPLGFCDYILQVTSLGAQTFVVWTVTLCYQHPNHSGWGVDSNVPQL